MYRLIIFHVNLPINRDTKINEDYQLSPIHLSPYFTLQYVINNSFTEQEQGAPEIWRVRWLTYVFPSMLVLPFQGTSVLVFCATSCINRSMRSSEHQHAILDVAGVVVVMPNVAPAATTMLLPPERPAMTRAHSQLVADLRRCREIA
jgi:hypothetical protein